MGDPREVLKDFHEGAKSAPVDGFNTTGVPLLFCCTPKQFIVPPPMHLFWAKVRRVYLFYTYAPTVSFLSTLCSIFVPDYLVLDLYDQISPSGKK